jgi:hypothetical protein
LPAGARGAHSGHWRYNRDELDERGLLEYRFRAGHILRCRCFVLPFAP